MEMEMEMEERKIPRRMRVGQMRGWEWTQRSGQLNWEQHASRAPLAQLMASKYIRDDGAAEGLTVNGSTIGGRRDGERGRLPVDDADRNTRTDGRTDMRVSIPIVLHRSICTSTTRRSDWNLGWGGLFFSPSLSAASPSTSPSLSLSLCSSKRCIPLFSSLFVFPHSVISLSVSLSS